MFLVPLVVVDGPRSTASGSPRWSRRSRQIDGIDLERSSGVVAPEVAEGRRRRRRAQRPGYDDLVDAVESETGSTRRSRVLYPTYAVVELPVDATSQREAYWYWDGEPDRPGHDGHVVRGALRPALGRPGGGGGLVNQVRSKVDDPTSWYAVIARPDDSTMISAYACNEYSETAYVGARRNGTITYDSTEH